MASIGKVSAVFSASTSGLKAGVSEASAQFRKLGSDVATLRSRMGTLAAIQGAQLFGSIASSAMSVANAFAGMARGEAEAIDQTSKLSRRLGMTYGELAGLALAGDLAGVSMEAISMAATRADVAFVKASQGSRQAQDALAGVGLSVDQLQNRSPAERFQMIADAIALLPTPAERARAAIALFGRSGAELLPLFEGAASAAAGMSAGFEIAAVSSRTLANATQAADRSLAEAANGSQAARNAFASIGLSVDQLSSQRPEERFQTITDAISKLPTAAERANATIGIFGVTGASLLPAFDGATSAIQRATQQAAMFGLALTDAQGQDVEAMNDAFTMAAASIKGVVQQVTAYLAPAIENVVSTFTALVGGIGGANIGQFIGDGIIAGAEFLATIADAFIARIGNVWEYAASVGEYWQNVWDMGNRVAAFLSGVGNSIKVIFAAAIAGITAPIANLLKGADFLAKRVGVDLGVENFIAGADAFNQSMFQSMSDAGAAAGEDFRRAFGTGPNVEPAAPVPPGAFSTMLADAVDQANASRAAAEAAGPQTVAAPPPATTATAPSTEAVKATDSRSKEGVAEMFRLMRNPSTDIAQQQLDEQKRTNELLGEADIESVVTFAGA